MNSTTAARPTSAHTTRFTPSYVLLAYTVDGLLLSGTIASVYLDTTSLSALPHADDAVAA